MKPSQIQAGCFYVNESRGLVREVTAVHDDGQVEYFSYRLEDGSADGVLGTCQKHTLAKWATRQATNEEIGRLDCREARRRSDEMTLKLLAQISHALPDTTGNAPGHPQSADEFTIRDEANALVAWAFRNGPIEDLHAGKRSDLLDDPSLSRITDEEMKLLMISASRKLAELLTLKATQPEEYERQIRSYNFRFCRKWER